MKRWMNVQVQQVLQVDDGQQVQRVDGQLEQPERQMVVGEQLAHQESNLQPAVNCQPSYCWGNS